MSSFVCRFAPSPNGRLHLGHALSALLNADAARAANGVFLLRIEDIDITRCRSDYERGIMAGLAWLGIAPAAPPRRQSEHFADYAAALARLEAMGLVYPGFESRAEIARAVADAAARTGRPPACDPDGAPLYPFTRAALSDGARARRRADGVPFVLRLDMAAALEQAGAELFWRELTQLPGAVSHDVDTGAREENAKMQTAGVSPRFGEPTKDSTTAPADLASDPTRVPANPAAWGDVVLARRDTPTSYHLSVVVDDAMQAVTHVIRGRDLRAATSVHVVLQRLLGLPAPVYHHHRLVLDEDGHKLSKSRASTSLDTLREQGLTPEDIRRRLALPLGA